jgi:glycosyltransferase involved in cell wall biosynthesis
MTNSPMSQLSISPIHSQTSSKLRIIVYGLIVRWPVEGEFGIAKHGYVVTRSGWFGERSAPYLATGRPVLAQDTGYSDWVQSEYGVISFTTPEEAMACSLPIVATDAPGVPDIIEGSEASGGLVVPCGDAVPLARALGRILDDVAWGRELGERARRRAEACFSLKAVGEQLHAFLSSQGVPVSAS